jgi:hypothetical protein
MPEQAPAEKRNRIEQSKIFFLHNTLLERKDKIAILKSKISLKRDYNDFRQQYNKENFSFYLFFLFCTIKITVPFVWHFVYNHYCFSRKVDATCICLQK